MDHENQLIGETPLTNQLIRTLTNINDEDMTALVPSCLVVIISKRITPVLSLDCGNKLCPQ